MNKSQLKEFLNKYIDNKLELKIEKLINEEVRIEVWDIDTQNTYLNPINIYLDKNRYIRHIENNMSLDLDPSLAKLVGEKINIKIK